MLNTLTRRRFLVLSCMAGTTTVIAGWVPLLLGDRKLRVAVAIDSVTSTEELLAFVDSPVAEIVAIAGIENRDAEVLTTLGRCNFSGAKVVTRPSGLSSGPDFEGLIWLRDKSDPTLGEAIASGKHVLLTSGVPLGKCDIEGLRPGQVVQVLPSRVPISAGEPLTTNEPIRQVRIARYVDRRHSQVVCNDFVQRNIRDELMIAQQLFDGETLIPVDVALCNTVLGPAWSARYAVVGPRGNPDAVHASVAPGTGGPVDSMFVQTNRRIIRFPIVPRPPHTSRVYFEEFVMAIGRADRIPLLGSVDDAVRASDLISKSTSHTKEIGV